MNDTNPLDRIITRLTIIAACALLMVAATAATALYSGIQYQRATDALEKQRKAEHKQLQRDAADLEDADYEECMDDASTTAAECRALIG